MDNVLRVLFLSRRNSARGVMAEALLNHHGQNRFEAFSAGVEPGREVDPIVYELLERAKIPHAHLRPKHFSEFAASDAKPLDFVFTLSDTAAGEFLPEWPGHPITAHWRSTDPQRQSDERARRAALLSARVEIERRVQTFVNLRVDVLDRRKVQTEVNVIGDTRE